MANFGPHFGMLEACFCELYLPISVVNFLTIIGFHMTWIFIFVLFWQFVFSALESPSIFEVLSYASLATKILLVDVDTVYMPLFSPWLDLFYPYLLHDHLLTINRAFGFITKVLGA